MSIERIFPHNAPTPRGPYSPAVRAGDFIFVSGQGPIDPVTDKLSTGDIKQQTHLVLSNIKRILDASGATMADVVKCSVFLKSGAEFPLMNEVYKEFFGTHAPARTTVVCEFVSDMRIEVDCVAYKPKA
ncbi:MAG TPA: RidA family protein [Bryobacteraceae bacterium]|jgi:2-iminobutanoate/2-iminopropanoate deaminase|nr:RidA family protein [Bryobacteraceae bacterium]